MNITEAENIFKAWQTFMEIWDKFNAMMLPIPPSFYPYPPEILLEGLDIMEQSFTDSGNSKMAKLIQDTKISLWNAPKNDEEAFESMRKYLNLIFEDHELKSTLLTNLQKSRDQWIKLREEG